MPVNFLPAVMGAKLTPIWHVPPAGTGVSQVLLARLKYRPLTWGTSIASVVLLLLCKVTDLIGASPVSMLPKLSEAGEIVSFIVGGLGVGDGDGVIVIVVVAVGVLVAVAVAVGVAVAVRVALALAVGVEVAVAVAVLVTVAVAVGVAVAVSVLEAVAVAVGVAVGDAAAVPVEVAVAVGVALAVGVGVPSASIDSNAPMSHALLMSPGSGRGSPR